MVFGRLFRWNTPITRTAALPEHLKLGAGDANAAARLADGIKHQGYDDLARQALRKQADDFVEYQQEACGGLRENAFDIAFFADGTALIIYQTAGGLVLHPTSSAEAEERLQDEKAVQGRFAHHWRKPNREAC